MGQFHCGTAIDFTGTPGAGPFTLTLAPGFTINGNVLGTGSDTFQLGTSLITRSLFGTFNVSNIGPAQQYRGFATFNKIGPSVWTLTGTGAQNWNISGGVLIGDTNSLQGSAINNNAALVFNQAFTGTYAGSIGGSGGVRVQGGRTVIYTGCNSYSGGTAIDSALQLGNGGASGSIVGDVVNNGTFAVNRSDTFALANMISGRAPSCRPAHDRPDREQRLLGRHHGGGGDAAGVGLDCRIERGDGERACDAGRNRHGDRAGRGDHHQHRWHACARRRRGGQSDRRRQSRVPECGVVLVQARRRPPATPS